MYKNEALGTNSYAFMVLSGTATGQRPRVLVE